MFLLAEPRLKQWLERQLSQSIAIESRKVLPSFQQYAEQLVLSCAGHELQCVVRTYSAKFTLWPPYDMDMASLVVNSLQSLAQQDFPAPRLLTHGDYLPGAPALLSAWAAGRSIRWPLKQQQIKGIAQTLAQLHACRPAASLPVYKATSLLHTFDQQLQQLDCAPARKVWQRLQGLDQDERLVWVHGDAHPGNFLQDANGDITLIDWDEAGVADYRVDVANMWGLLSGHTGKEAADWFISCYEQASGTQVGPLGGWWLLLNLRDWLAVEHLKLQNARAQLRSDMANWIAYADSSYAVMLDSDDFNDS